VSRLPYFVGRALANLRARPWPTAVTVSTIALAFLLLAGYLVVFQALARAAEAWGERLELSAYLHGRVADPEGLALAARVAAWPEVARAAYVSKDEALARFRAALGGQASLLDALPGNPLPTSVEVALRPGARSAAGIADLAARLGREPEVAEVEYGREEAERLATLLGVMRGVGLSVAALLALVATVIVASTVRLAFYMRQDEVDLLRLVGASERFVRAPFLIEGMLQGAAGAGLALLIAALAHRLASQSLAGAGGLVTPEAVAFLSPATASGLLAGGALLGLVGSFLSVSRSGSA
jgi:cell division transport system permease protein